jgi:UDP-N-acetylmuramoylalanine--D-glutamate ligase
MSTKKIIKQPNNQTDISVALLGLGIENQELLKIFDKQKALPEITICDFRTKDKLPAVKTKNIKINYRLGEAYNKNLSDFNLLFRSPGWPLNCPGIKEALKSGRELSSPFNFFLALCPTKNIIGVSGTKGKGTTATLIYKIIGDWLAAKNKDYKKNPSQRKQKVWLGGNIGISPLSFLEKIDAQDYVVLELSSFQLEDLAYSPKIAVLTNLFKEHLAPADPNNPNFHASLAKYWQAKLNIAKHSACKYLVANEQLKNKLKSKKFPGKIIYFSASDLPSRLSGDYNRQNIAAAVAVAKILKIKTASYEQTISKFKNLEHRLELAAEINGVKYFDNSFSTTPESTALDLESFKNPIIQIAGGADKGADFKNLAKTIKRKTSLLILLPGAGTDRIFQELKKINFPVSKISFAGNMEEAVKKAKAQAQTGDVVLLSTACASFGLFKNYKERGDLFKKYVKKNN